MAPTWWLMVDVPVAYKPMKAWIEAFRLKTLPLAISSIGMGAALAFLHGKLQGSITLLAILTAVLLQILSNLANDYGDYIKGTDRAANRTDRALASGKISPENMKTGIIITALMALGSGLALLMLSLTINVTFLLFLLLGILAILAAITYTVGKRAFAYSGLGDLVVFIFFGPVAVLGTFYLMAGSFLPQVCLASIGMGMLAAAVLNVNNMRDIDSDQKAGKNTLALRLGKYWAMFYHKGLVLLGFLMVFVSFLSESGGLQIRPNLTEPMLLMLVYAPVVLLFTSHVNTLKELASLKSPGTSEERAPWNQQLKKLSLSILLLVALYWLTAFLFVA